MPPDPPTAHAPWHALLAENDRSARARLRVWVEASEPALLRRRVAVAGAELTVVRAAVARRSTLLSEHTMALAARDRPKPTGHGGGSRSTDKNAMGDARPKTPTPLRRLRFLVGRLVRYGLRQP